MNLKIYVVHRVMYGKPTTPKEEWEYYEYPGGPVGCRKEILDWATCTSYTHVKFIEKNGTVEALEVPK